MKRLVLSCLLGLSTLTASLAAPSILDIKHSITDDNIIPPESFETQAIELEQQFYLRNFVAEGNATSGSATTGTPEEYAERLSRLPVVIEMPYNDIVGKFINMYLGKRQSLVSDMLSLHNYYGRIFVEELEREGMPLELQYLPVIESAINPNAVSRAGATGLWQFMPGTAKGLGMEVNSLVDQRRDPRLSSRYAAKYLKQLYEIYNDWSLAIAAYNCGPGNVNKALRKAGGGKKDFWEIYNYLPSETRGYVPAFIAANYVMNYHNLHNISPRVVKQQLVTDTVMVNNRVNFNQIAAVLNIPVEEIRMLNPQFRKDVIPGNNHPYALTLPSQQVLSYVMSEDAILEYDRDIYEPRMYVEPGAESTASATGGQPESTSQSVNAPANADVAQADISQPVRVTHVVAHGESLRDIARRYNVSVTDIKRWNDLRRAKVKEGDRLVIETFDRPDAATIASSAASTAATTSDVPAPPAKKTATTPAAVPAPKKGGTTTTTTGTTTPNGDGTAADQTKTRKKARGGDSVDPAPTKGKKGTTTTTTTQKKNKKKTTPAKPKTYTAKSGDSLEKIAKAHGVTVDALRKANGMGKNDSRITIGQTITIPSKGTATTTKSTTKKKGTGATTKKKSKKRR